MIIDNDLFEEIASRGVSQKTWDKMNSVQRAEYIKKNPTSRYAENVKSTKPVKPVENKTSEKEKAEDSIRSILGSDLYEKDGYGISLNTERTNNDQLCFSVDIKENSKNTLRPSYSTNYHKFPKNDYYKDVCLRLQEKLPGSIWEYRLRTSHIYGNGHTEMSFYCKKDPNYVPKSNDERLADLLGIDSKNLIKNKDGSYDVKGSIIIPDILIEKNGKLRIKFNNVTGDFILPNTKKLESLEGCPKEVGGTFSCSNCGKLTSLKGAPQKVGKNFDCSNCEKIESLEGCPKEVGESFSCEKTKITSLKGAPQKVGKDFNCSKCIELEELSGGPKKVSGKFSCRGCGKFLGEYGRYKGLITLSGAPEECGEFDCSCCPRLRSLIGCPKIVNGDFYAYEDCSRITDWTDISKNIKGNIFISDRNFDKFEKDIKKSCKLGGDVIAVCTDRDYYHHDVYYYTKRNGQRIYVS